MVRAILDGRKTQTRRMVKRQPAATAEFCRYDSIGSALFTDGTYDYPAYNRGDILYVRETFWCANDTDTDGYSSWDCGSMLSLGKDYAAVQYVATPESKNPPPLKHDQTVKEHKGEDTHGYWWLAPPDNWDGTDASRIEKGAWEFHPTLCTKHPSIHMPKWAARIFLRITDVRVERLNDISEEDAKAEGVENYLQPLNTGEYPSLEVFRNYGFKHNPNDPGNHWAHCAENAIDSFRTLWDSVYNNWNANPWVWVYTFEKIEKP